jgi:hypothetical protein
MNDPEQVAFRRLLRARTRSPPEVDDENWQPHPSWEDSAASNPGGKRGPPLTADPSPSALAARRYRERIKSKRDEGGDPGDKTRQAR